jgi:hypothetical protein
MNKSLLILFTVIALVGGLNAEEWTQSKTWFGDPDLQGTWTNASLTNLERPDYYDTLIVSEEEARTTLRMSEEFSESVDNPYEEGESPQAGDNVGGYNVAWMDPGTDLFKLDGEYRSSILTYPEDGKLPRRYSLGSRGLWDVQDVYCCRSS